MSALVFGCGYPRSVLCGCYTLLLNDSLDDLLAADKPRCANL
jgi:hypothetical protein